MSFSDSVGGELKRWWNVMPISHQKILRLPLRGWMRFSMLQLRCSYGITK